MTAPRPSVLIATPCHGGVVSQRYFHSVLALLGSAHLRRFDIAVLTTAGDALVSRGRDALLGAFLDSPAASHLLFIDPDVGFEPDAVSRLLAFDADIAAVAVPPVGAVPCVGADAEERGGFVTCVYAGASFMMVKRGALERLVSAYPAAPGAASPTASPGAGPSAARSAAFACMRDPLTGQWLGEDFSFCCRFRAIGGKIWLDARSPSRPTGAPRPLATPVEPAGAATTSKPDRRELRAHPLETDRLLLAPLDPADSAEVWAAVDGSRRELEAWLPTARLNTDAEASRRNAVTSALEWDQARSFRFTIRDRETRALYGVVGVEGYDELRRSVELGYWLRSDATGRGFATEAARAVLTWTFTRLGVRRVSASAATENHASLAVIRRLGFRFEGVAREVEECQGRPLDHAVFSLLATDPRG